MKRLMGALTCLFLITTPLGQGAEEQPFELAFSNAPIDVVVNTIMQELKLSYMIDPSVSGTVNLFTPPKTGIPKNKLFEVLEQILKMNGQAIVQQNGLFFVVPIGQSTKIPHHVLIKPATRPREKKQEEKPTAQKPEATSQKPEVTSQKPEAESQKPEAESQKPEAESQKPEAGGQEPQTAPVPEGQPAETQSPTRVLEIEGPEVEAQLEQERGVITYIIPLHYIPSGDMVNLIKPFVSDGATLIDFAPANMIMLTDYRRNIQQVLHLVSLLDTQYFDINTVELIPIHYNQAKDVAEDLAKIFSLGQKAAGVRMVAIERLNSILVVTYSPSVLEEVKGWVEKLDVPSASSNLKTFVYLVENNTAANIAQVLAELYRGGAGLPSGEAGAVKEGEQQPAQPAVTPPARELGAPGLGYAPGYGYGPGGLGGALGGVRGLGPSLVGRPISEQSGVRAVVSGNIRIIVNEFNNSLIVQATEADYQFLLQTIKQLDVLPRQVVIEAKIYSVELRDELSFGVAAFLEQRGTAKTMPDPNDPNKQIPVPTGPPTTGQITPPSGTSPGGALAVTTRAFIGMERQLEATINALRSRTNVRVLEAPRIMATDGMQAQINVGADVPVTTNSFGDPLRSGVGTAFINSIQFRPTGTTLLILPRITAGGIVTMDLSVEVSQAVGAALTPTINRNFVETSLVVRDGQTIAIAGIISDSFDTARHRVPLLGDIPILGAVFGQSNRRARRSELVVFITPHVIPTLATAAELTRDFQRSLKNAYEFIQEMEAAREELIQRRRRKELEENKSSEPQPVKQP